MGREAPSNTSAPGQRDSATIEAQPTERSHLLGSSAQDRKSPTGKQRRAFSSGKACLLAIVVILLIILAIIMTALSRSFSSGTGNDSGNNDQYRKAPTGPTPSHPADRSGDRHFNSFSTTESFEFSSSEGTFAFLEHIEYSEYVKLSSNGVDISGNVQISPADKDQEDGGPDIKVWVNVATVAPLSISNLRCTIDKQSIEIHFPEVETNGWHGDHRAYFDFAVAIHVRKGVQLNTWLTSVTHLNVNVDSYLFAGDSREGMSIKDDSLLQSITGRINANYWNSRRTVIDTISGRIEGSFALRDELKLTTKSGTIFVDVDPKSADKSKSLPAEFTMKSISGSMSAIFPTSGDIPDRDYRTIVESNSGRIEGSYMLGKETSFHTSSARIDIAILPYATSANPLSLHTATNSGSHVIDILDALHANDFQEDSNMNKKHRSGVLDSLTSYHGSISGSIETTYPQNWEGNFHAKSISGNLSLRGKDVRITDSSDRTGDKYVRGYKGDAELSQIECKTVSGRIEATIGDVTNR